MQAESQAPGRWNEGRRYSATEALTSKQGLARPGCGLSSHRGRVPSSSSRAEAERGAWANRGNGEGSTEKEADAAVELAGLLRRTFALDVFPCSQCSRQATAAFVPDGAIIGRAPTLPLSSPPPGISPWRTPPLTLG
jgi:hypothetical protein